MSQPDIIARWAERASDRLNPILVKETRQALKSKQFMATFAIMLFGGWLISAFVLLSLIGVNYDSPIGRDVFPWYFTVLALTVVLIVPFGAFRSLLAERDQNTYEILNITTLSPSQIIWGKWLSSQVQTFIYFSAISPFIAFTYLLRGVDFPTLAFVLVTTMFASMLLAIFALTFSTLAHQRQAQVVLSLALLGGLFWTLVLSVSGAYALVAEAAIDFSDTYLYWMLAVVATYYVAIFVFCLQCARARLTFESDNRSTGIRLTCSAIVGLTIAWIGLGMYFGAFGTPATGGSFQTEPVIVAVSFLSAFMLVICLFAATETDPLSRRCRSQLPRSGLFRLLAAPFLPGGGRGMLYTLLHAGALSGFAYLGGRYAKTSEWWDVIQLTVGFSCYMIMYAGFASFIGRRLHNVSPVFGPAQTRALMITLYAVLWLAPNLLTVLRNSGRLSNPLLYLTDPVYILELLATRSRWGNSIVITLVCVTGFVVILNSASMWRGFREVLAGPPAVDETTLAANESTLAADPAALGSTVPQPSTSV